MDNQPLTDEQIASMTVEEIKALAMSMTPEEKFNFLYERNKYNYEMLAKNGEDNSNEED